MASQRSVIPVPWRLLIRRARYQFVPIVTMIISMVIVSWLWMRNARSVTAIGEVNTISVAIESKVPGMLAELPQPVRIFDTVRKGQVIARLDLDLLDKELARLQAELESLKAAGGTSAAIKEHEARIAELTTRLAAREIKSPIDGTVMKINEHPGQTAKVGMPIMRIDSDRGDFILGYVREAQSIRPKPGMVVTVRQHAAGAASRSLRSYVASVAPQVQKLPKRFQRNPNITEWALTVQVAIPPEAELKPGEMVDLVFHPEGN